MCYSVWVWSQILSIPMIQFQVLFSNIHTNSSFFFFSSALVWTEKHVYIGDLTKQNESHVCPGAKWVLDMIWKRLHLETENSMYNMAFCCKVTKQATKGTAYYNWMHLEINIPNIQLILLDQVTYISILTAVYKAHSFHLLCKINIPNIWLILLDQVTYRGKH